MQYYAIVLAGGSGLRMGNSIPKQFLLIHNKPILQHTLERISMFAPQAEIILTLPEAHIEYWNTLSATYQCKVRHKIVAGGPTRFHSVKNALAHTTQDSIIAIHDGVRPLVTKETWSACEHTAYAHGAAIPSLELTESIREIDESTSIARDRSRYRLVQTPQTFRGELVKKAYEQEFQEYFTDDASVVEALGHPIFLVNGNQENIKITRQFDILIAEALFESVL